MSDNIIKMARGAFAKEFGAELTPFARYHVHGSAGDATVTVSVDAVDEMDAQRQAWQVCPAMDVSEIEETA
jgi:hypothetical protein